jgi:NAD(P)H-hydrate repair Nnr-like enzyme with NAD(P)H-hydrate dehydratase domain
LFAAAAAASAGTIGTFIAWQKAATRQHQQSQEQQSQEQQSQQAEAVAAVPPLMLAAYAGCITMRAAAVLTYKKKGRSMVAGDMIDVLGDPVLQHCGLLPGSAPAGPATKL